MVYVHRQKSGRGSVVSLEIITPMKYIVWSVFILICFPLGQVFHRIAGLESLNRSSETGGEAVTGKQLVVFTSGDVEMEVWIDPATVREDELPSKVTLKRQMEVSSADGASVVALEQNTVVQVIAKSGNNLTVSALSGPLKGIVPVQHTDLLEQVARTRILQGGGETPAAAAPTPAPAPVVSTPAPAPVEPTPPAVTQVDPPEMTPTPPAPTPAPVEPAAPVSVDIVQLMQASIKGGQVKEFTFDQVQAWKVGEEESVDGEDYQTGLAAYKAETIFGVKTVQAKALVQKGKLVKWVYAKTGMEIR
jgi:hypothetical protein